ncbi:UNVERIFIED_CONTAM: hypothetical protein HDU68_007451 [Siphonaria sp. JEL0065]|nr:hypothetical protein HDU68_007451 [Siphonaria sp. JEL0065]
MFLKLVAKDKLRSWTTITWAVPLIAFSSYGLYKRLYLGEERKPTPDIFAPFTPIEGAPPLIEELGKSKEPAAPSRFELAKRPFEK